MALKAIDFYSGVGGWSLGLSMAGITVVGSYEWWKPANRTNELNNRHPTNTVDIRELDINVLPVDVDIVVGSPPCTQFSFSNRGGRGDIEDGLKDIKKFLEIVEHVQPKFWAMENVPRVAAILEVEFSEGGRFHRFSHLKPVVTVVDTSEWGLPQRRKRCIVGNFDFDLLNEYRRNAKKRILGEVVKAFAASKVIDPIYGIAVEKKELVDHVPEEPLSREEERINREMKVYHPVYNNMAFPEPLTATARTVTATCTRVSRESLVISSPEAKGRFRRLTLRERASLQGFPITFQFFGASYSQKLKMVGNAIPPLFTYYVAHAFLRTKPERIVDPQKAVRSFRKPTAAPSITPPDGVGRTYPIDRSFRAAVPGLRFKSGVRFEFANHATKGIVQWSVRFFFGNSKDILTLPLDKRLHDFLMAQGMSKKSRSAIGQIKKSIAASLMKTTAKDLQNVWCRQGADGMHPHDVVDVLGASADELILALAESPDDGASILDAVIERERMSTGADKLLKHSNAVAAGLILGSISNALFQGPKWASPSSRN